MKKIIFILFLVSYSSLSQDWIQIGNKLDGDNIGDRFSTNFSISKDGKRVAIASFNASNGGVPGYIKVYQIENQNWTQIGQKISGNPNGGNTGSGMAFSGDGNIIIANFRDQNNSHYFKVFKLENNSWIQIGENIKRESDEFGGKINASLNYDGSILVFGDEGYENKGNVRVFNLINNEWKQLGNTILPNNLDNYFGSWTSISNDGNIIAIGSPVSSNNGNFSGSAYVFELIDNNWIQMGNSFNGEEEDLCCMVSLNSIGDVIALGASSGVGLTYNKNGYVRVFKYENEDWIKMGENIIGENEGDYSGAVSLSNDGKRLAIGASQNDGGGEKSGHMRIFEFLNNSWVKIGNDIDGLDSFDKTGGSTSGRFLSGDGNFVAVGSPQNDSNNLGKGYLRIFEYTDLPLRIEKNSLNHKVYPSPTSNYLRIHLNGKNVNRLLLFDINGKELNIKKIDFNKKEIKIDVSNLDEGLYILHLVSDKEIDKVKVLIER